MFKRFFSKKDKEVVPDKPIGFGYKNKWIAVKSSSKEEVAKFLNLRKVKESNWENGIKYGYEKGIFISPEINEWILVLGIDVSDLETEETKDFLKRASKEFGECQIFLTHRVVEYHFWGLARNGEIKRLYSYVGESGENMIINGEPTEIERNFNLVDSFSDESKEDEYWEREDIEIPDEETVMKIAENWSVNPTKIGEYQNIGGVGLIGN